MSELWLDWNQEKNQHLKQERGLCFEDVEHAIEQGRVLDDLPHPNSERYPHQRLLIVEIDGYACVVPYVTDGETRFLKTIYRSRQAQKHYLRSNDGS